MGQGRVPRQQRHDRGAPVRSAAVGRAVATGPAGVSPRSTPSRLPLLPMIFRGLVLVLLVLLVLLLPALSGTGVAGAAGGAGATGGTVGGGAGGGGTTATAFVVPDLVEVVGVRIAAAV